jgi:ribose 5-phosphate isomerase RpiB
MKIAIGNDHAVNIKAIMDMLKTKDMSNQLWMRTAHENTKHH